jgi:DNA-binding FadR family transcriptional regulator
MDRPESFGFGGDAINSPAHRRSRELFCYVTATEDLALPSASRLADQIESLIWTRSRQALVSTERDLAIDLGVGRRLTRQACRVLQQRGVVRMRRGGGGGLMLDAPSATALAEALAETVRPDVTSRSLAETQAFLTTIRANIAPALSALVDTTLAMLRGPARAPLELSGPSAAASLARALLDTFRSPAGTPRRLGALSEIAEAHEASLEVAVEAIRLLADRQLVELRRGRGGGVYALQGGHAQVIRSANAFFVGQDLSIADCDTLLRAVLVELIRQAGARGESAQSLLVPAALAGMEKAETGTDVGRAWFVMQRQIAVTAESPLLHILARCLAGSIVLRRVRSSELPDLAARELVSASRVISDNIQAGREQGNQDAHWRCQGVLAEYW